MTIALWKRVLTLIVGVPFCLLIGSCKSESEMREVADEFLGHFSASCNGGRSQWTEAALSHSRSMINVIEMMKIKQEENCKGVTQALSAAQNIYQQLERVSLSQESNELRLSEERRMAIIFALSQLSSGQDPIGEALLRQELYLSELEVAENKARVSLSGKQEKRLRLISGLGQLTEYFANVTANGSLAACLEGSPLAPFQVASSLVAIGGNFATPLVGASLTALGQMMGSTVEYMRKLPLENAKIDYQNTMLPSALSCSLESVSQLYCDADASLRFIHFALDSYGEDGKVSEVWEGLDLLGKEVPRLNAWLDRAANGSDNPKDGFGAQRINAARKKREQVRHIQTEVIGEINNTKKLIAGAESAEQRDARAIAGFKSIVGIMYSVTHSPGGTSRSPFFEFKTPKKAVCEISDAVTCDPTNPNQGFEQLIDDVVEKNGPINFVNIDGNARVFVNRAIEFVDAAFLQTVSQDGENLVALAVKEDLHGGSVVKVLQRASVFADKYIERIKKEGVTRSNQRILRLITETKEMLDVTNQEILDISVDAGVVLENVFKRFKLLNGISFLNERLTNIVRWDIEDRIKKGEIDGELADDFKSAGRNIVDQLAASGINLGDEAQQIEGDIKSAIGISKENLFNTNKFLAATVQSSLEGMHKISKKLGEDYRDNHRIAKLCMMVLTTTYKWPEEIDRSLCKGTKIESVFPGLNLRLSFDKLYKKFNRGKKTPFEARVCTYSNFLKASKIFQKRSFDKRDSGVVDFINFENMGLELIR